MVTCTGAELRAALAEVERTRKALDEATAGMRWEAPGQPPEWPAWRAAWDRLAGFCDSYTTWRELQALAGRP